MHNNATIECEINNDIKVIITSIYMDKEEHIHIEMLEKISSFSLIIGSDTNSHLVKFGGAPTNKTTNAKEVQN